MGEPSGDSQCKQIQKRAHLYAWLCHDPLTDDYNNYATL